MNIIHVLFESGIKLKIPYNYYYAKYKILRQKNAYGVYYAYKKVLLYFVLFEWFQTRVSRVILWFLYILLKINNVLITIIFTPPILPPKPYGIDN